MKLKLTVDEVKEELGIYFDDPATNKRLKRYISLADKYLKGAINDNYPGDDERAIELALLFIEDLYDRKSYTVKETKNLEKLKDSLIKQLKWGENYSDL